MVYFRCAKLTQSDVLLKLEGDRLVVNVDLQKGRRKISC